LCDDRSYSLALGCLLTDRRARVFVYQSEFEITDPKYGYNPELILKTIRYILHVCVFDDSML